MIGAALYVLAVPIEMSYLASLFERENPKRLKDPQFAKLYADATHGVRAQLRVTLPGDDRFLDATAYRRALRSPLGRKVVVLEGMNSHHSSPPIGDEDREWLGDAGNVARQHIPLLRMMRKRDPLHNGVDDAEVAVLKELLGVSHSSTLRSIASELLASGHRVGQYDVADDDVQVLTDAHSVFTLIDEIDVDDLGRKGHFDAPERALLQEIKSTMAVFMPSAIDDGLDRHRRSIDL
jgi:hypothetical protein